MVSRGVTLHTICSSKNEKHQSDIGHLDCFYVLAIVIVRQWTSGYTCLFELWFSQGGQVGWGLEKYKRGGDYECIWLLHFTIQQELIQCWKAIMKEEVKVTQSCPTLCDPVDCSLPGSSLHGILQARILMWVADPFSRGSSQLNSPPPPPKKNQFCSSMESRSFCCEGWGGKDGD